MVEGMITVKEYAEQKGKSVQSVYKQMKSKENAVALEGHIHVRRVNNRDVKLLDEDAVRVLDEASNHSIQVILETDDKRRIEELEQQIEVLKDQLLITQNQLIAEQAEVKLLQAEKMQLQSDKIALLEAKQEERKEPEKKSWLQRMFGK